MRTLDLRKLLGLLSLLAACTPETDLQNEQTEAAGTEGEDGQLSGSSGNPQTGQLLDPPTGAADIATNLASVIVRFLEPVAAGDGPAVLLQPAGPGEPVVLQLGGQTPCSATCYTLIPSAPLSPTTAYTVKVPAGGLQFLDGKPVPAGDAGVFTTAPAADTFAPRIEAFTMQIAAGCATVHVAADEQVRAQIVLSSGSGDSTLSSPGVGLAVDFSQRLPAILGADPHASAIARVSDRSGNQGTSAPLSFEWPAPVPALVITEVLANPAGSETTQEFVELFNAGEVAVELAGWTIEDKTGKDVLPEAILMPGAFAVVVAESYDPADGKDPAPAQGTLLVRVSGRIGSDGLSNSGEPVHLVSPGGQIVSQYGGWVDVSATAWSGRSTKRFSTEVCDAVDAWSKAPSSPTPGW
jgi:hypothetical protein